MKALFLQPTTYQTDDFLSCRLWERQDASFVRTAMTHINMQVLLVLGEYIFLIVAILFEHRQQMGSN